MRTVDTGLTGVIGAGGWRRLLPRLLSAPIVGAFVFFSIASTGEDLSGEGSTREDPASEDPTCEPADHCRVRSDGTATCEDGYRWRNEDDPDDFVCVVDTPAPSSRWNVTFVEARIADQDPNGGAWDAFGGAPDPLACITVGTTAEICTSIKDDTFSPSWNEVAGEYGYNQLGDVLVELFDEDVSDYEWIAGWSGPLQPSVAGRAETFELTGDGGTWLRLTVAPAS